VGYVATPEVPMADRPPGFPITLLVPGPWAGADSVPSFEGWSVAWIPNDGHFGQAFRYGAFPKERVPEIEGCAGALLVEGRVDLLSDRAPLTRLAGALVAAGAFGVRVEESKVTYAAADWARLVEAGALFRALVVLLSDQEGVASCGMHVFGLPDAEVADPVDGARLVSVLCLYQIAQDPVLLSGHTFQPDEATPRRTLERWPDGRYPESHSCCNPFGVWRMLAQSSRKAEGLVSWFMPSLEAQLLAAENKAGRPLTREEVEAIRDRAPVVAVKPRDARTLERSRGYADLDPDFAYEQLQIVRTRGRAPLPSHFSPA
jgi:hypothetical protein